MKVKNNERRTFSAILDRSRDFSTILDRNRGANDDYQDKIRYLVVATKMRANPVGAKRYVSPSSIEVKTEKTQSDDDDDDDDDCCILDFNPFESATGNLVTKLSLADCCILDFNPFESAAGNLVAKLSLADCCILDFNPFESAVADLVTKLSLADGDDSDLEEEEISILSVKGEVACRDFPHSRHLYSEFLFEKTPHESYCAQCYWYVCDTPAPCKTWKGSLLSHCHVSDKQLMWKDFRTAHRKKESEPKS